MTNYEKMIALVASPATPKDIVGWAYINRICLVDLPSEPEFACMEASVDKFFETHNPFNDAQGEEQVWREFLGCQYVEAVSHVDKRTVYGRIDDAGNFWRRRDSGTEYALVTPAELAKVEAEARIGRAVREFVTRQKTADYYRRTTSDYERGYKDAVDAVEIAITKAREGKPSD